MTGPGIWHFEPSLCVLDLCKCLQAARVQNCPKNSLKLENHPTFNESIHITTLSETNQNTPETSHIYGGYIMDIKKNTFYEVDDIPTVRLFACKANSGVGTKIKAWTPTCIVGLNSEVLWNTMWLRGIVSVCFDMFVAIFLGGLSSCIWLVGVCCLVHHPIAINRYLWYVHGHFESNPLYLLWICGWRQEHDLLFQQGWWIWQ